MIDIGLKIHDIRKIQNSVQEILEKVIFTIPAEAGFDNQAFISAAEEAHHITGAIGVIDALENHLILRNNILWIPYDFWKHEHAFMLKLL